jgi:hypothetical protein
MGTRGPTRAVHDHRDGERGEDERDLEPREVRDQLQVERREEEDGEDRDVGGEGDGVRRRESRVAQELELQHRVWHALLDEDEDGDE